VITLEELFQPEGGRKWSEPALGLNVHDVLRHKYKTEKRFVPREERKSLLVGPVRGNALVESVFGVYPTSADVAYIQEAYTTTYRPATLDANPKAWRLMVWEGAETPLLVTRHGLDAQRFWHHDLLLFVFNPARATDLIDLWNLRLEPHPVLPIPLDWFDALADDICEVLKKEHRPVIGNPSGIMHHATIEFGRSIPTAVAEAMTRKLKPGLPAGAVAVKHWRNQIWIDHRDGDYVHRDHRMKVVARESRADLAVNEERGKLSSTFETLAPNFSDGHATGAYP
jgi:hypothetical protein